MLTSGAASAELIPRAPRGVHTGSLVLAVELRSGVRPSHPEALWRLIEIRAGATLTEEAVRETLHNLHALGGLSKAEVRLRPEGEGVRVFVVIHQRFRVRSVAVEGDLCVRRSTLENRIQQRPGTPLSESRIVRGVYRLQETLADAGYENATVRLDVEVDSAAEEAEVSYRVECGDPTLVEAVIFEGDLEPLTAADLEEELRLKAGARLQQDLLATDAGRLQSWLVKSGFRTARVGKAVREVTKTLNRTTLRYSVSVGPRLEIVIRGADEKLLRRKKLLDLLDRERFDEGLLLHVLEGVRRFYQERGHYDVGVAWELHDESGSMLLEILIREGPVYSVGNLEFRGNEILRSEDLAERLTTGRSGLFGGAGRLVDEQLQDDLENLRAHYARQGFRFAKIGPAKIVREGGKLTIEIPVEEGPQQRLVGLEFSGIQAPEVLAYLPTLAMSPGGPFHARLLEEMLDEIRAAYEDAGYPWAQVSADVTGEAGSDLKDVSVQVLEGPKVEIARVILRGNARTQSSVILRSLGIGSGDTINRRVLLDAQRRLYRLGIFSSAEVRLAPGMPFARHRDVLVRVEEGRPARVSFGLGYDSEDGVRTLLGYSYSNLGGRALSARVDLRVSEREEQFRALLRQPFLGRWRLPVTYSLFAVEEEQESFESRRRGAQIEGHRQHRSSRLGLLYTYKIVEVVENPGIPLFRLGIDRNLQEAEISSLTPSLLLDHRDDLLIPSQGWTLNLQTELAFPLLSAKAEFFKIFGQHTLYRSLGSFGVLAGSLRIGAIEPQGSGTEDVSSLVPISEQFFAGGRTTHRAYRRDRLGIPGETLLLCNADSGLCVAEVPAGEDEADYRLVSVGGNGLFLFNLDYRFPLAGPLGGTVFVDAGNVWSDWQDLDPDDLQYGAGVGLRYLSPIGPLRLEVGWKVDPEPGESSPVFFLSFGNPF